MSIPAIEVTIEEVPLEVTVSSTPLEVVVSGVGVQGAQGPPGQGIATFSAPVATPTVGTHRWYAYQESTITEVRASVGTAPTGSDIIVDINKNGSTIFLDPDDRPRIISGEFTAIAIPGTVSLDHGDYLTVDIDQGGSLNPGTGLTVQVFF